MPNDALKPDYHKALSWLDDKGPAMIGLVETWARINTATDNIDGLKHQADVLCDAFAILEPASERVPLAPTASVDKNGDPATIPYGDLLRFRKRPEAPRQILLCIHYDTVFPATDSFQTANWLDDNTLNGPGVADAKGGILVILHALQALENSPWKDGIGWEVVLNPDEETGSHGSMHELEKSARDNKLFAMVYEPALEDGTLAGARKGSGNYILTVRGKAAHAGRGFHAGRNAITALARFINGLDALNGQKPGATFNAGFITGGGPTNVVPDLAQLRLNIRVESHEEQIWAEAELARLSAVLNAEDGFTAELSGKFGRPPKPLQGRTLALFEWVKDLGRDINIGIAWKATGGCCDGNNFAAWGLPNIDTLGVRGGAIHSHAEFVKTDSFVERAKLSALILMKTAAGDLPDNLLTTEETSCV